MIVKERWRETVFFYYHTAKKAFGFMKILNLLRDPYLVNRVLDFSDLTQRSLKAQLIVNATNYKHPILVTKVL